uniref:Thioredoxin domain-containing protein n=2 Tax=Clastoptera arizonana TaxID=38151 RepID=A0A1B6CNU0_9HEMI
MLSTKLIFGCNHLKCVNSPIFQQARSIVTTLTKWKSIKIQDPEDFDEKVKKSKIPVIVDFFATWCHPCKALTPRIESVIAEKEGKIVLAKVDIDENSGLADDYKVSSVPVLLVMRNGKVEDRIVGLQDTDKLREFIEKSI